jgi:predicted nuclease of predicted toxin-antitoxin system
VKFLIDNALSPLIAARLAEAGHDGLHVRDIDMATATDERIFARAAAEHRILVSADTNFGTLLAASGTNRPSCILLRRRTGHWPKQQAALLLLNLPGIKADLAEGAMVVFDETRIRVRRLPIGFG